MRSGLEDYSASAFLKEVQRRIEKYHWTAEVSFGVVTSDLAFYCNHWVEPRLDQAEFYRIVADAAASMLPVQD